MTTSLLCALSKLGYQRISPRACNIISCISEGVRSLSSTSTDTAANPNTSTRRWQQGQSLGYLHIAPSDTAFNFDYINAHDIRSIIKEEPLFMKPVYNEFLRLRSWVLVFESVDASKRARNSIFQQGRGPCLGAVDVSVNPISEAEYQQHYMDRRLDASSSHSGQPLRNWDIYPRGCTLVVSAEGVSGRQHPRALSVEAVTAHFSGYALFEGGWKVKAFVDPRGHKHFLVRFNTPLEAAAALRDEHGKRLSAQQQQQQHGGGSRDQLQHQGKSWRIRLRLLP